MRNCVTGLGCHRKPERLKRNLESWSNSRPKKRRGYKHKRRSFLQPWLKARKTAVAMVICAIAPMGHWPCTSRYREVCLGRPATAELTSAKPAGVCHLSEPRVRPRIQHALSHCKFIANVQQFISILRKCI